MKNLYFNEYFGIKESTEHLNIPLDEDKEAFICPFKIVNNRQMDLAGFVYYRNKKFLEHLNRKYIIPDNRVEGIKFLSHLHESNEYHLGYSEKNKGKGIGKDKAVVVYDSLRNNKFASQGISVTNESQNVLLLVSGIGPDNMSDTISNVCRDLFADFTYNQCVKYGISTEDFEVEYYNPKRKLWELKKAKLPVYENKKIVLVPKNLVSSSRTFYIMYNRYISSNYIAEDIMKGKIKVDDYGKYVRKLPKGGEAPNKNEIFDAFRKPKNEIIDFVVDYGDKTLLEFQDYVKEELPEIDFED